MAFKKISQLNTAAQPLSGSEKIVMNQSGSTVTSSVDSIKDYIGFGNDITVNSITLSGGWIFKNGIDIFNRSLSIQENSNDFFELSGGNVIAIGQVAGKNSDCTDSVFIGREAGFANTGGAVVAIGGEAGGVSSGNNTVYIGGAAGSNNTGDNNICIGSSSGIDGTGSNNIFTGVQSGQENNGSNVNALGVRSAFQNTGSFSSFLGLEAGYSNVGSFVNAIGEGSATDNTGNYLDCVGYQSGVGNSGTNVIAFGQSSGELNSGNRNIFIGSNTTTSPTSLSGCIVIGSNATATSNNQLAIGSTAYPLLTSGTGTNTNKFLVIRLNNQDLKIPLYS